LETFEIGNVTHLYRRLAQIAVFAGAIVTIFSVAAGCGGSAGPTPTAAEAVDGKLSVVLRNYAFEPERLRFEAGETVEFGLVSTDELHTFTVRELGINWALPKKEEPEFQRFTFEKPGTYKLICAIPGHAGSGMVGEIVVE